MADSGVNAYVPPWYGGIVRQLCGCFATPQQAVVTVIGLRRCHEVFALAGASK